MKTLSIWLISLCSVSVGFAQTADLEVGIEKNVRFLGEGRKVALDLYLPPEGTTEGLRPGVVIIHGGGWHGGDKAAGREKNIATNLAKAGFVCVSANYVLAKKSEHFTDNLKQVWPRNLQDCLTAVQFLRANAEKYQVDSENIGAIGGSAGGHLVAMMAAIDEKDQLDPKASPYPKESCRIQAVVPMYGVYSLKAFADFKKMTLSPEEEKLCVTGSPITYLDREDPPFLLLHGTADPVVPYKQTEIFYKELKKAGTPCEKNIIKGAKHSFHLEPAQEKDLKDQVIEFLDNHLKDE